METLKVIFGHNKKPASVAIELFTLSWWCHCGIIDDRDPNNVYVIDTTLSSGGRAVDFEEWKTHYSKYEIREFPVKSKESSLKYANSRIGLDYDYLGILSFVFRSNVEDKNKDFCSQLVADVVGITHTTYRLSPAYLYRLSKSLEGWIL